MLLLFSYTTDSLKFFASVYGQGSYSSGSYAEESTTTNPTEGGGSSGSGTSSSNNGETTTTSDKFTDAKTNEDSNPITQPEDTDTTTGTGYIPRDSGTISTDNLQTSSYVFGVAALVGVIILTGLVIRRFRRKNKNFD